MNFPGAEGFIPDTGDLKPLATAAQRCRGCDLYENATQAVFGEGPRTATMLLVGEQPGDVEDREGEPFVGPSGDVLDRAMAEAGVERAAVYLTNAVKHFRWKTAAAGGKRRIHEKPTMSEVGACRPWLAREISIVHPHVIVGLGATAGTTLMGKNFRLSDHRGELLPWPPAEGDFTTDETPVGSVVATIHPSAVLRAQSSRDAMFRWLVEDLQVAAQAVHDG